MIIWVSFILFLVFSRIVPFPIYIYTYQFFSPCFLGCCVDFERPWEIRKSPRGVIHPLRRRDTINAATIQFPSWWSPPKRYRVGRQPEIRRDITSSYRLVLGHLIFLPGGWFYTFQTVFFFHTFPRLPDFDLAEDFFFLRKFMTDVKARLKTSAR